MSDLFHSFVFDLQRFEKTVLPYNAIGNGFSWAGGESKVRLGFPTEVFNATNVSLDAMGTAGTSYFSLSSVNSVFMAQSTKIGGLSFYAQTGETAGVTAFFINASGSVYFGGFSSGQPTTFNFGDNDKLFLTEDAVSNFNNGQTLLYKGQSLSALGLKNFDMNGIHPVTGTPTAASKNLQALGGSAFQFNGLSAGDSFELTNYISVEFENSPNADKATAGGSVAFNTDGKVTGATVESGGILAITSTSASITDSQNVTINNFAIDLETAGLTFDNTSVSSTVYLTSGMGGFSSVVGATIAGEQFSVRGLDEDYNGFVMGSESVAGFVFASDETEATLIFAQGSKPAEGFTVYNGAVSGGSAYALPTVVDAGDVGVAIAKSTEDDKAQFALVGGSGAQVEDADGDTNITYTAAAASYFAEFVFNASGSLLGVKPGDNFLTGASAPEAFQKGTAFDVTGNVAASAADGLFFGNVDNKVALAGGSYTYGIEEENNYVVLGTTDDTVYALGDADLLFLGGASGQITDNINGNDATYDYKSGGSAYFNVNSTSGIYGFGFVSVDDAIGAVGLSAGFGLEYYDSASNSAVALTADVEISGTSKAWIEMTQADGAEFEVNNFGGSAVIGLSSAQFTFDADTAAALQFSASGIALGFNATSGTVTMNQDAANYLEGGSFAINDVAVDIEAVVQGELVFDASESSLFGLSSGTKINDAGDITKVYGASGAGNELTVGSASFVYTAVSASKADRAFFTVDGTSATGFTFQEVGDALTLGKTTPKSFELTNGENGTVFDAPVVYESEDSQDVVDAYTVTKVGGASFEMSGFSEGNYTVFEPTTKITFQELNGTSAAIAFEDSGKLTGINKLAVNDEVKVANPEGAINFDDATVEILGTSASFVYHKTGAASSILEDVSANVLINQLGGASQVITAEGQSGTFVFTEGGGQTFGVYNYSYSGYADDVPGGYSAADISGVRFNIDSGSKVTSIANISDKEYVDGNADAFAAVTEINGQAFAVSGASYIAALGTSSAEGLGGLFLDNGASVAVTAVAGAPAVVVADIADITFGASSTFKIEGRDSHAGTGYLETTEVVFYINSSLSVTGIDDIGAQESITGDFAGVLTANGVSFAVDGDDKFMIVGTSIAEGIGIIANVSDSASILNVGGASYVITDEEGTFTFAGHSVAFQVEGDSSVTFQMVDGAAASVAGVKDFYATGDSIAVLTGELIGLTINDSEKDIDVTGDEDNSFAYMVDASGNATLGGVGASSADAEVVITGTGGASTVNVISDGVYTFNISGTSTTFTLDIANNDTDGVNFVLDADGNVTAITSFDKGDVITGSFSTTIDFAGLNGTSTAETSVQVLGDSSITVEHDAYIIKDVSDLATIKTADGIVLAITDTLGANDTLQVTDTDGDTFVIAGGDSDGVQLILDGAANIVGVSSLDEGATIGGDLGALSSINGKEFFIAEIPEPEYLKAGDGKYSVVGGASSTIAEVIGLSGLVVVGDAGGASVLRSDGNIVLANEVGGQSFMAVAVDTAQSLPGQAEVNFYLTGDSVTAIDGIGGDEVVLGKSFDGVDKLNGKEFSVVNDADNLAVLGRDGEEGIYAIIGAGNGDGATIETAAGASFVLSNSDGVLTFGAGSAAKTFELVTNEASIGVGFYINDSVQVQAIDYLDKADMVIGDFTEAISVNGEAIQATDDVDQKIIVIGSESWKGVSKLAVQANATVTSWGSASAVDASGEGNYVFIGADGDTQTFTAADTSDSRFTFVTDKNDVTGIEGLSKGYVNFQTSETSALDVNIAQYPGQTMTFDTASNVSLSIDPYEVVKVEGVTGSVSGIVGTDTPATVVGLSGVTNITVNGKPIEVIEDGTTQFNVIVHDTEPDYVYDVQGDATVNAADVSVRANSTGSKHASENAFVIGSETYTMDDSKDENDGFTFVTGASGIMTAVASLEGALIIDDGEWDGTINGGEFSVAGASTNSVPVTVNSGVDGIESVGGLEDGDSVAGALSKAQVRVPGDDDTVWINGKPFNVIGDDDGVDVTGEDSDVITDLDNEASLTGPDYPVTVNGTALEPEDGDIIKGRYDKTDAYILDTAHQLIRKSTALYHGYDDGFNIEDISGLPYSYNSAGILDREETDSIASGSSTLDLDQPLSFFMDNVDEDGDTLKTEQVLDLSGYEYTKRVTLWDGDQAIKFNDEGGNFARVSSIATGVKNISLGAGGDAVVMDEDYALQNAVNIYGGAGKDSIYVRHSANTTIDLSAGGEDIIVTAGEAEARITLAGYQASTGAAIRVEEYLDDTNTKAGTIADGIENGTINFAEGLVIIESPEGRSEINVGTNGDGGQIVNLMTHATSGNDVPQAVGFTGADGGSVDGSAYDSPLIMIGNKDNTDSEGSILRGGSANDTFYGGQDDLINTGAGNDLVKLYEDDTRGGAYVEIGDGRTTIEGMNNTLADSTGDTLAVAIDPNDKTFSLLYNDSLQALEISSSADGYYALLEDVDTLEGNYTTQYIYDSNADTLYSVAIGTEGSVIEVTEDEDLRPNVFFGYNTAIDFRNYTGDAIIDLRGDLEESIIDETIVIIDDDITTLYAGEGEMAFKGDLDNETFYAGKGDTWLYGDGGKNLLVGYDGDDKEGQTVFYVLGNEDGAAHTIAGFNFVNDDNYTDNKKVTADMLEFDFENNDLTRLEISGNDLLVEVTDKAGDDTESGLILGAINDDGTGNDMIVSGVVAQVADDKLVFDQFADFYYAAGKNATVEVSSAIEDDVVLWLDDDDTGKNFEGDIKVIDARKSDATAQLAGNDNDNVIYAGTGETSLWGGEGGNDLLVGNSGGRDTFYYSFGNGDDTITNVKDGDLVALDVSLDQIDEIDMSDATAIRIIMNDGDVLTIEDEGASVGIMIDNGEDGVDTYYTDEARSRQ